MTPRIARENHNSRHTAEGVVIEPAEILDPAPVDHAHNSAYASDPVRGSEALDHIDPPRPLATIPELLEFTDHWLANEAFTDLTRAAYRTDLEQYLTWCDQEGHAPLAARFTHINAYARRLESQGRAPATVARKLSAVSSWYDFLLRLGAVSSNPVAATRRPKVDRDDTTTVGFSPAEAAAIVAAARADKPLGPLCATALAETMVALGARVSELCLARLEDLGYADGHRTLRLERMKGGRRRTRPLPPAAVAALDAMLETRPDRDDPAAPLFVDAAGRPLDRHMVYRFVRRAARAANVPSAAKITPHSFRHAWATTARIAGAPLEARQHALGHKDPRTTQRYDRAKLTLDTDPAYLVAAAVAEAAARAGEDDHAT